MRELAVLGFVPLNGVMQAPGSADEDTSGGFEQGGWATPYWEGVMGHVLQTAMADPYDIVLGRKTYDLFAGHWPTVTGSPAAERLNSSVKHVLTSSPLTTHWEHAHALTGDLVEEVLRLKSQDGPLLQVHGSGRLVQALHAHGLIDEYRLWTFPVVVGEGKRLFGDTHGAQALQLTNVVGLDNGVVSQTYRRTA